MKKWICVLLVFFTIHANGQIKKNKSIVGFIPAINTRINGLALGLALQSLLNDNDSTLTYINGISVEIIGFGILVPLSPSSPVYFEKESFYENDNKLDSLVNSYDSLNYKINGLSISTFGIVGHNLKINGINLSGFCTLTGKMNGLSVSLLMNFSDVVNGISIGLINTTIQSKGIQIGLYNQTKRMKGLQIGLWNVNEKRSFPFINWKL